MGEVDVEYVRDYVEPARIAEVVGWDFSDEEALTAGEAISRLRLPQVIEWINVELTRREIMLAIARTDIETKNIIDIEDYLPDYRSLHWSTATEDVKNLIEESGYFVCMADFKNVRGQVRTSEEYIVNTFHTLILAFYEGTPAEQGKLSNLLRYNPTAGTYRNEFAAAYRFYLRADMLMPYASYKVTPEYKIPGVGYVARKLMRAVLYDDEDIEEKMAAERARFDIDRSD